jgi:electron transfer flavoprotein alpha subunit
MFDASDVGIVGDYREVVPLLIEELAALAAPANER